MLAGCRRPSGAVFGQSSVRRKRTSAANANATTNTVSQPISDATAGSSATLNYPLAYAWLRGPDRATLDRKLHNLLHVFDAKPGTK